MSKYVPPVAIHSFFKQAEEPTLESDSYFDEIIEVGVNPKIVGQ